MRLEKQIQKTYLALQDVTRNPGKYELHHEIIEHVLTRHYERLQDRYEKHNRMRYNPTRGKDGDERTV